MIGQHIGAAIVGAGLIGGTVTAVITSRAPCVTVQSATVITPAVYPGEELKWELVIDRHKACPYHRTDMLVDGMRNVTIEAPLDLAATGEVKQDDLLVLIRVIPETAQPGPAEYFRWGQYQYPADDPRSLVHELWPLPAVSLTGDGPLKFTILEAKEPAK